MRTFDQKPDRTRDGTSHSSLAFLTLQSKIQTHSAEVKAELPALGQPRLGYDFGRIPLFAKESGAIPSYLDASSGDRYEQEADRVAVAVMRMPAPEAGVVAEFSNIPRAIQKKCECGGTCANCGQQGYREEPTLQRKPIRADAGVEISVPPFVRDVLSSPGQSLDSGARYFMESRFGYDFSQVRAHTDETAADSARALNALAYTVGRNVVFGAGRYSPNTIAGRELLAHELSHVVQQQAAPEMPLTDASPNADTPDRGSAGSNLLQLSRVSTPRVARKTDTRTMPGPEGGTDKVDRIVTPGKCALEPESRASTTGDITASTAFLQIDLCRGSVSGQIRGELDYGDALQQAGQAVSKLLSSVGSGQPSSQALGTLANDLKQLKPGAQVKLNLLASDVFRLDITGLGDVTPGGTTTGKGTARAEFDVGPVKLSVEGSVSGGSQQQTRYEITGDITFGGTKQRAPDCFVCKCGEPNVSFACTHLPDKGGKPPPPLPPSTPRYIPYFFSYSCATPNAERNKENLNEVIKWLDQGYTIASIEGSASPEGPVEGKRRGMCNFENNTELAMARAAEAKKQLDIAINQAIILRFRTEHLRKALSANYPVVGRGELFGSDAKGEVSDPALLTHLEKVLAPPKEGQPDVLAQEHVTGEGLSSDVLAITEADVEAFRNKKLPKQKRLDAIYETLRRALITLNPPPKPPVNLTPTQEQLKNVIGESIACTDKDRALFAGVPIEQVFEGDCKAPGKQGEKPAG